MAKAGPRFTPRSAKRISAAVLELESQSKLTVPPTSTQRSDDVYWFNVKNESGEVIPGFSVVRLDDTKVMAPGIHGYKGYKPSTTFGRSYAITCPFASTATGYVMASFSSPMRALYDTGTPVNGETWGPKPGQWTLSKGYPGFVVLGVIDATKKIMAVRPEEITTLRGKTDSTHSKGVSGTVSVYAGVTGSESDTTWDITAYNRFATVASGKWVWCAWAGTGWDLISAECG